MLEAGERCGAGKVRAVVERLARVEEPQVVGRERLDRERLTVVAVLEDDADAMRRPAEDVEDALAQERDAACAVRLAAVEEEDGPAGLVVRGVEPVALREGGVGRRRRYGLCVRSRQLCEPGGEGRGAEGGGGRTGSCETSCWNVCAG